MSLIAGIVSRRKQPVPDSVCAELARSISRNPADKVVAFRGATSYLAKVDIGNFGEPGVYEDMTGAVSLLAGEPLLTERQPSEHQSRLDDLKQIHEQGVKGSWDVLREASGTFCVVHYQPDCGTLVLAADKLGVRPLYYWLGEEFVVFASALRVLEDCPLVPKRMDLRAVTEKVGLETPLSDRTPYAGISLLKAAEILLVKGEETSRQCYWRWDEIEESTESEEARLQHVYEVFQSAVDCRLRSDRNTTAYLSGGLDSRCVVAALNVSKVGMHTVNFARPGTLDHYCGNEFAKKIGTKHLSLPKEQGDRVPDYSALMTKTLEGLRARGELAAERPGLVWSGEGGSVLLGLVHLSESIVELMRTGKVDAAIYSFLEREQVHVSSRLFRGNLLNDTSAVIKQGIREELNDLHSADPGRNFYLFLALNDQRRKLADHFENLDLHRLEFQLPFFDAQLVSSIIATKLDWCLRHKFYVKLLGQFPPLVTAVPWQVYPGREPCPLPVPSDLGYQWDDQHQADEDASQTQRIMKQATELLRAADFPHQILSRRNLRLAAWVHARGWRDYRYAFVAAQTYFDYAKKCGGKFTFSWAAETSLNDSMREIPTAPSPVITCVEAGEVDAAAAANRPATLVERADELSSPNVSVIVPAYNAASFIRGTLDSVFAQTFKDYEVIVINDGSPDTEAFELAIEPYRERIRYISQENGGASSARNAGLRAAKGKFIAFLDADDVWYPNYLEEQLKFIREQNCDLACADALIAGDSPDAGKSYMDAVMDSAPASGQVTFLELVSAERSLITSGVVARRDLILEVGLFDLTLRNAQDLDLWLRLARHGSRLAYHRRVLLEYHARSSSLTGDAINSHQRELRIFDKIEQDYPLTPDERRDVSAVIQKRRAHIDYELGKLYLLPGDFTRAQECFSRATDARLPGGWKPRMALWLTRFAPRAMRALYVRRAGDATPRKPLQEGAVGA